MSLDTLVTALGGADESAELRHLKHRAKRADQLESQIAALGADPKQEPDRLSIAGAFALGLIAGKEQAAQEPPTGFSMMQDARQASKAALRRQQATQRPALAVGGPQP